MAIAVTEKWESRTGSSYGEKPGLTLIYLITGTDDDAAAEAALVAALPDPYRGLVWRQPRLERIGAEEWLAKVSYGELEPENTGDVTFEGDTSGGTQHINQSYQTVGAYKATTYAGAVDVDDFQQAIGVTNDSVEGVDVIIPGFRFTVSKKVAVASVTSAYLTNCMGLTGKVNDANFQPHTLAPTFAAGECLFEGLRWRQHNQESWHFTYRFNGSPNVVNLQTGNITVAAKAGHDYVWYRYTDQENATLKQLTKRPIAAYVERVYEQSDFSVLGL